MKNILTAPFMTEMIRTTANMYAHGWDERNGGNISMLLDEAELAEYLGIRPRASEHLHFLKGEEGRTPHLVD